MHRGFGFGEGPYGSIGARHELPFMQSYLALTQTITLGGSCEGNHTGRHGDPCVMCKGSCWGNGARFQACGSGLRNAEEYLQV